MIWLLLVTVTFCFTAVHFSLCKSSLILRGGLCDHNRIRTISPAVLLFSNPTVVGEEGDKPTAPYSLTFKGLVKTRTWTFFEDIGRA